MSHNPMDSEAKNRAFLSQHIAGEPDIWITHPPNKRQLL